MGIKPSRCFTQKHIQIQKYSQKELYLPKTEKKIHIPRSIILKGNSEKNILPIEQISIPKQKQLEKDLDLEQLHLLYQQCLQSYSQHKIDKAFQLTSKMYAKYDSIKQRIQENDKFLQQCKTKIEKIRNEYEEIKQVEQEIQKKKWNQQKKTKNCVINASYEKSTITSRLETQLQIKVEVLFQVLSEVSLYTELSPIVSSAKCAQQPSANSKIGHISCKIPLLASRQSFFLVHAYNRLQHDGTLLFLTKSLEKNQILQKKYDFYPKLDTNSVAIIHKYILLKCQPKPNGKVKIILTSCLDMESSLIPKFALDWLIGTASQQIYAKLHTINNQYSGSKWEQTQSKNKFLQKLSNSIEKLPRRISRKKSLK